jgi:hypothetical protein
VVVQLYTPPQCELRVGRQSIGVEQDDGFERTVGIHFRKRFHFFAYKFNPFPKSTIHKHGLFVHERGGRVKPRNHVINEGGFPTARGAMQY